MKCRCLTDRKPSVWSSQVEHGGEGFKCQKTFHICFSGYHTSSIVWWTHLLEAIFYIQLNKGHHSSTSDHTGHGIAAFPHSLSRPGLLAMSTARAASKWRPAVCYVLRGFLSEAFTLSAMYLNRPESGDCDFI